MDIQNWGNAPDASLFLQRLSPREGFKCKIAIADMLILRTTQLADNQHMWLRSVDGNVEAELGSDAIISEFSRKITERSTSASDTSIAHGINADGTVTALSTEGLRKLLSSTSEVSKMFQLVVADVSDGKPLASVQASAESTFSDVSLVVSEGVGPAKAAELKKAAMQAILHVESSGFTVGKISLQFALVGDACVLAGVSNISLQRSSQTGTAASDTLAKSLATMTVLSAQLKKAQSEIAQGVQREGALQKRLESLSSQNTALAEDLRNALNRQPQGSQSRRPSVGSSAPAEVSGLPRRPSASGQLEKATSSDNLSRLGKSAKSLLTGSAGTTESAAKHSGKAGSHADASPAEQRLLQLELQTLRDVLAAEATEKALLQGEIRQLSERLASMASDPLPQIVLAMEQAGEHLQSPDGVVERLSAKIKALEGELQEREAACAQLKASEKVHLQVIAASRRVLHEEASDETEGKEAAGFTSALSSINALASHIEEARLDSKLTHDFLAHLKQIEQQVADGLNNSAVQANKLALANAEAATLRQQQQHGKSAPTATAADDGSQSYKDQLYKAQLEIQSLKAAVTAARQEQASQAEAHAKGATAAKDATDKEIQAITDAFTRQIQHMQERNAKLLQEVEARRAAETESLKAQRTSLLASFGDNAELGLAMQHRDEAAAAALAEVYEEFQAKHAADLAELRAAYEQQSVDTKHVYETLLADERRRMAEQLESRMAAAAEQARSQCNIKHQNEMDTALEKLRDEHKRAVEALQKRHAQELAQTQESYEKQLHEAKDFMKQLKKAYDKEVLSLKDAYSTSVPRSAVGAAKADADTKATKALKEAVDSTASRVRAECNVVIEELRHSLKLAEGKLAANKADMDSALALQQAEYNRKLRRQEDESNVKQRMLEDNLRQTQEQARRDTQRLMKEAADARADLQSLRQTFEFRVREAEQLIELRYVSSGSNNNAGTTTSGGVSHASELRELTARYERMLENIRHTTAQQLKDLEAKHAAQLQQQATEARVAAAYNNKPAEDNTPQLRHRIKELEAIKSDSEAKIANLNAAMAQMRSAYEKELEATKSTSSSNDGDSSGIQSRITAAVERQKVESELTINNLKQALAAAQQEAASQQSKCDMEVIAVRQSLNKQLRELEEEKDQRIRDLQNTLETERSNTQRKVSTLEHELHSFRQQQSSLQAVSAAANPQQAAEEQIRQLREQHHKYVEQLEGTHSAALADMRLKHAAEVSELSNKHRTLAEKWEQHEHQMASALRSRDEAAASALADVRRDMLREREGALDALRAQHTQETADLRKKYDNILHAERQKLAAETERQLASSLVDLKQQAAAAQQRAVDDAVSHVKREMEAALKTQTAELNNVKSAAEARMQDSKHVMSQLRETYEKEIAQLREALDAATRKQQHDGKSEGDMKTSKAVQEAVEAAVAKAKAESLVVIYDLQHAVRTAEANVVACQAESEAALLNAREEHAIRIRRLEDDHAKRMRDLEDEMQASKGRLRQDVEKLRRELVQTKNEAEAAARNAELRARDVENAHAEEIRHLQEVHRTNLLEAEARGSAEVMELRNRHLQRVNELESKCLDLSLAVDKEREERDRALRHKDDAARAALEELRAEAKKDFEAALNSIKAQHTQEVAALMNSLQHSLSMERLKMEGEMEQRVKKAIEETEGRFMREKEQLSQQLSHFSTEAKEKALMEQRSSHNAELQSLTARYEGRLTELRTTMQDMRVSFEKEAEALRNALSLAIPKSQVQQMCAEIEQRASASVHDAVMKAVNKSKEESALFIESLQETIHRQHTALGHAAEDAEELKEQIAKMELKLQHVKMLDAMAAEDAHATILQRVMPAALAVQVQRVQQEMHVLLEQQLQAAHAEFVAGVKAAEAKHNEEVRAQEMRLIETSAAWDRERRRMQESVSAAERQIANRDRMLEELRVQSSMAITKAQQDLVAALQAQADSVAATWQQEKSAIEAAAQNAIQSAVAEATAAVEAARRLEIDAIRADAAEKMRLLEREAAADKEAALAKLEARHRSQMEAAFHKALGDRDASVRQLLEEKSKAIADLTAQFTKELQAAAIAHDGEVRRMRSDFEDEKRALAEAAATDVAQALAATQNNLQEALVAAERAWEQRVAKLMAQRDEEQATALRRLAAARETQLANTIARYERICMSAEEQRLQVLTAHDVVIRDVVARGVAEAESETVAALGAFNAEWMARLEAKANELSAAHVEERERMHKRYQQEWAAKQAELETQRANAIAAVLKEAELERQALAEQLQEEQERAIAATERRMLEQQELALQQAAEEREEAIAAALAQADLEKESAIVAVRKQANREHEEAMEALRLESDRLLANIEGALTKLKEERDYARNALNAQVEKTATAEEMIAMLRKEIQGLQHSGTLQRLRMLNLAARFAKSVQMVRAADEQERQRIIAAAMAEWSTKMNQLETWIQAERERAAVLLKLRANIQDALTGFKRDTVMEHKVKTMELAQEIAALADSQAELTRNQQALSSQLAELEGSVRVIEREMGDVAKQGIIGEDGTVNINLTRKKKRLDRDLDAALARLADRRSAVEEVKRKMAAVDAERAEKEEALRAVEADLISTLVQQQRALMQIVTSAEIPAGADANLGNLVPTSSIPALPTSPNSKSSGPLSPRADTALNSSGFHPTAQTGAPNSSSSNNNGGLPSSKEKVPVSRAGTLKSRGNTAQGVRFEVPGGRPAPEDKAAGGKRSNVEKIGSTALPSPQEPIIDHAVNTGSQPARTKIESKHDDDDISDDGIVAE